MFVAGTVDKQDHFVDIGNAIFLNKSSRFQIILLSVDE